MDRREFERAIEQLMKQDFSAGTEAFREELLARCLETLNSSNGEEGIEVSDSELEMLAAAGSPCYFGAGNPGLNGPSGSPADPRYPI